MNFYKSTRWKNKRDKILRRDEYKCQECKRYGKTTAASTVHHVYPMRNRPEFRLVTWNLLSLCGSCHDKMHDRTTDQLTELGIYWRNKLSPPPNNL